MRRTQRKTLSCSLTVSSPLLEAVRYVPCVGQQSYYLLIPNCLDNAMPLRVMCSGRRVSLMVRDTALGDRVKHGPSHRRDPIGAISHGVRLLLTPSPGIEIHGLLHRVELRRAALRQFVASSQTRLQFGIHPQRLALPRQHGRRRTDPQCPPVNPPHDRGSRADHRKPVW
jgi:hypothetical protein